MVVLEEVVRRLNVYLHHFVFAIFFVRGRSVLQYFIYLFKVFFKIYVLILFYFIYLFYAISFMIIYIQLLHLHSVCSSVINTKSGLLYIDTCSLIEHVKYIFILEKGEYWNHNAAVLSVQSDYYCKCRKFFKCHACDKKILMKLLLLKVTSKQTTMQLQYANR